MFVKMTNIISIKNQGSKMELFELIFRTLTQVWYLVPLLLIFTLFKTNWWKGVFGEFMVNRLLSSLPDSDYKLIKDVTLPTDDGTTQIDHVVISKFGIFVVETKNMKGWIFGTSRQKQWTQKIYRHTSKFQNPLHQNYKHTKTLQSLLNCKEKHLHSVVVFVGNSTFKNKMPPNVTHSLGCLRYIKTYNQVVFSNDEYLQLIEDINNIKLKRGIVTDMKHRKHVKDIVAKKNNTNQCSSCGSKMVIREIKKGKKAGSKFLGCSSYPKCRMVQDIK